MDENLSFGPEDCRAELQCIGLLIAYFRKLKKFILTDLATRLHINESYLSHLESGSADKTVSLPLLIKISRALDVELSAPTYLADLYNSNFNEEIKIDSSSV